MLKSARNFSKDYALRVVTHRMDTRMTTKLQLTNEYGIITIETHESVDECSEFINNLVRPILKAAGFLDSTVNDYIGDYQAVEELAPRRVSDFLRGFNRNDDGGVTSSPDFEDDPDEESFAQTDPWTFGDTHGSQEGAPYVDPYDMPMPKKPKRKAKKK